MVNRVSAQLEQLTTSYVPVYGHLARMNIRSLERALALRRMIIAKMQSQPDAKDFLEHRSVYEAKGAEVGQEAEAALAQLNALIEGNAYTDTAALVRIENRVDIAHKDLRRYLNDELERLLPLLDATDFPEMTKSLARVDVLRDEFNQKVDAIRADMMAGNLGCLDDAARRALDFAYQCSSHRARRSTRTDIFDPGQHWNYTTGAATAGRHTRGRSRPSRRIDHDYDAGRGRSADGGLQSHG
jgi:hypothetical protein